jgi:CRP/FNR family transcriptional regulator, cyclic AMP receptor protein
MAPSGNIAATGEEPASGTTAPGGAWEKAVAVVQPAVNDADIGAKHRYLSEIEIFADLSRGEIDHLARSTTMFTTEKGKVFYFPEEAGEVVFLLKKGKVQLYRLSSEGRKLAIATLGQGAIFGEMSLIGQGMYNTFAEAMEDCLICIMSRQEMAQLLIKKPQIALRILDVMGRRLQQAETQLEEVAFKKVPERLALLLLRLVGVGPGENEASSGEAGTTQANPLIITGLTHQDLAEMVATHRDTVSFTLNEFKARGFVDLAPKHITVLDVEGLRALCT